MKKILLLLWFLAIATIVSAQTDRIDKLKHELESHPQQDTVRVNLLMDLFAQIVLEPKTRKGYAEEALAISQKINYLKGQGFAFSFFGNFPTEHGNLSDSKTNFFLADSIADVTGNLGIKADLLLRRSSLTADVFLRDSLLGLAYHFAVKANKLELQARILLSMADDC